MQLQPLKIGPWQLPSPFVLAPMAGVTDAPFRRICRQFGAGMTTSEMTTADTSLWETAKSKHRLGIGRGTARCPDRRHQHGLPGEEGLQEGSRFGVAAR